MNTLKENLKIINAATITGDSREENIYRELRNLIEEITDKYESPEKLSDEKIDMTATIKQYGYDADEYKKMFGSTERSERDVVENLANLLVEKGYAKADGKKEEPKKSDDEDKAKKIKLLKLKAKAAKAKLALMQLGCVNGVDVATRPQTFGVSTGRLFDDELQRDRWQKRWDSKRRKYIYTDSDDNEWYKNEHGHYCLLNGTGDPSFSFDWEGRVAYVSGFDADEYEAAKEFCASMVDEKVMHGSGWHFGAEGYDNRSQSWRFFILYGAMAAGVGNTGEETPDSKWYIKAFRNIKERFPSISDSFIESYVANYWDNYAELYDNLNAFKEHLDDEQENYAEGGELFELDWSDYTERGTVRPLYHCEDLYGDDYDFAEKWLTETLAADNLSIDRMWIDERMNCYEFLAK
jgi:hypothetical protein